MQHVTIETPNCDCFIEPSELGEVRNEIRELILGLQLLDTYCKVKASAMERRLKGDIADATRFERLADDIFRRLPAELKW